MTLPLDRLMRWMQAVVTHPGGVAAGADSADARAELPGGARAIGAVVEPSATLEPDERLSVYANMYFARLIEVLEDDFPATRHALGEERFDELARAYCVARPSRHYSLNMLGAGLAAFVRDELADVEHRDFLVELIELERTIDEVFDAPRSGTLALDDVLRVPSEHAAGARFETIPALRLLEYRYPVNAFVRAVRRDEDPAIPAQERPIRLVVWRRDGTVWRSEQSIAKHAVLKALHAGATLGEALERAAETPGADAAELANVGAWFQEWTGEGMFRSLVLPE